MDKTKAIAGGAIATSGGAVLAAEHWDLLMSFANYDTLGATMLLVGGGFAAAAAPKKPPSFSSFFNNSGGGGGGGGGAGPGANPFDGGSNSGGGGAPTFKFTLLNEHFDSELEQLSGAAASGTSTNETNKLSHRILSEFDDPGRGTTTLFVAGGAVAPSIPPRQIGSKLQFVLTCVFITTTHNIDVTY